MRTGRSLTVCWSQLPGAGAGVWSRGGSGAGGVYPSMHWGRPPLWIDRRLWKYYLGPTSLRPVTRKHSSRMRTASLHQPWVVKKLPDALGGGGGSPQLHWRAIIITVRRHPQADLPFPETATAADSTHPTGMHSCFYIILMCDMALKLMATEKLRLTEVTDSP